MDTRKIFILIGVVFLAVCVFTVGVFLFFFLKSDVLENNFDSSKSFQPVAELILPEDNPPIK